MPRGWGSRRIRRADLDAPLPTRIHGIAFSCRGPIWFRAIPGSSGRSVTGDAARTTSLAAAYAAAREETTTLAPDDVFAAEQAIAGKLSDWQPTGVHSGIEFRARLRITLSGADAARNGQFNAARRAAQLSDAIARDRMEFLTEVVLKGPAEAQLWWLQHNVGGPEPATSWDVFDQRVRPLISHAESADAPAAMFAKTVVTLLERIGDKPDRLPLLIQVTSGVLHAMGWPDLADEAAAASTRAESPEAESTER
jgi:hypothetical protein